MELKAVARACLMQKAPQDAVCMLMHKETQQVLGTALALIVPEASLRLPRSIQEYDSVGTELLCDCDSVATDCRGNLSFSFCRGEC